MTDHWFKKYFRPSLWVGTFQILGKVWRQWRSLVNQSFGHCSTPVAYSVSCKFNFIFYCLWIFLWNRFWSCCITNTNAPRISENPASFLVTGPLSVSILCDAWFMFDPSDRRQLPAQIADVKRTERMLHLSPHALCKVITFFSFSSDGAFSEFNLRCGLGML
jgi:hypothetical protein